MPPANSDTHTEKEEKGQTLIDHLLELRSRLLKCIFAIFAIFLCLFPFSNELYNFVADPLVSLLPTGSMIAINVTSTFLTPFKLTLFVAAFFAMPFILWQLWQFVAPALYKKEKQLAIPLFLSSVVLFYLGVAFAYYVIFPLIFAFFTATTPDTVTVTPDIASHLNLAIKLFFAFGLAFEIPVATVLLIASGVISPQSLAKKRHYVVVSCFVIGMLLTPPDIISQTLLALPMWLLFEIGIFCGRLVVKSRSPETEESA